jgi:uncharacterized protein YndB with AHSA1/START domain
MPNYQLKLSRLYNATCEELFEAWTNPDSMKQWMCPEGGTVSHVELDLRVGGAFRIDMKHGQEVIEHRGVYQEIKALEKLVFTWVSQNTDWGETLVTIELFERGEQTELVLTQIRLPSEASTEAHTAGWTSILERLAIFFQNS